FRGFGLPSTAKIAVTLMINMSLLGPSVQIFHFIMSKSLNLHTVHTVHTVHTYIQYIQYIHTYIHTVHTVHTVHTYSTYIQYSTDITVQIFHFIMSKSLNLQYSTYIHTVHTYIQYIHTYIHTVHTYSTVRTLQYKYETANITVQIRDDSKFNGAVQSNEFVLK
ncbi:hypothetical protein L9F63_012104, partial [Diploptera punctata]